MTYWKVPISIFGITTLFFTQCYSSYSTVMIRHELGATFLIRNIRFNGCVWPESIQTKQKTMPRNCLRGEARVYYEAFNMSQQGEPQWIGYQTKSIVDTTSIYEIQIPLTLENQEPDLNAPGPFGH